MAAEIILDGVKARINDQGNVSCDDAYTSIFINLALEEKLPHGVAGYLPNRARTTALAIVEAFKEHGREARIAFCDPAAKRDPHVIY